jgi:HTH-type transcriptional regulator, cell division transcriptional repressor
MSSVLEKQQFSLRLKDALKQQKHPISPTYLSTEFNHRYSGQSVSIQSANNWLLGKAIPSQDKLSILSMWLDVSSHWLRFGESPELNHQNIKNKQTQYSKVHAQLIDKFSRLTKSQQHLINNLIDELIR